MARAGAEPGAGVEAGAITAVGNVGARTGATAASSENLGVELPGLKEVTVQKLLEAEFQGGRALLAIHFLPYFFNTSIHIGT